MVRFNGAVPNVNQATRRNDTCRYPAGGVRAPVHARGRIRCSLFPWRTLFLNPTDGLGEEVRPRMAAGANSATCTAADLINARPTNGACDVLRTGRNASATSQYADRSSCPGNSRRHSVASEKNFSPISPRRISAREHIRPAFVLSPKRTIPTIAVPAVATPTKLA